MNRLHLRKSHRGFGLQVPFNAGPRVCLGMNLAMLEMKLVIVGLLSRFHVEVVGPKEVTYDLSLTLPVKGALNVKVSRHLWPAHA
ncbi:Cytochrome P450 [Phytophthora infestans]|uniref:Cytochrome P450 n=1 Tax=Phytophthora infestans TaxID=4787 RepID=A0A8S9UH27_PHYIN|nr:Cytochrome P450 [Phytophthora infestans]